MMMCASIPALPGTIAPVSSFALAGGGAVPSSGENTQTQVYQPGALMAVYGPANFTNSWHSAATQASASLTQGTLRAGHTIDVTATQGHAAAANAYAAFGDSYRFGAGSNPPTGTNVLGTKDVRFSLDLSGLISQTAIPQTLNFSAITLAIIQAGQLENARQANLPYNNAWNLFLFQWGLGADSSNGQTKLSSFPATLDATFAPGGDFDWFLVIRTESVILNAAAGDRMQYDFLNTVRASFTAPNDVTVYSHAGSLGSQQLNAIPEPATAGLMAVALLAAVWRRKRT